MDNESGAMRRMMRTVVTSDGTRDSMPLPKQNLEINPSHPIIVGLHKIQDNKPVLAQVLAEQVDVQTEIGLLSKNMSK